MLIWDSRRVEVEEYHVKRSSIMVFCRIDKSEVVWAIIGVYGQVQPLDKPMFCEELDNLGMFWDGPWLLSGDFNIVKRRSEWSSNWAS